MGGKHFISCAHALAGLRFAVGLLALAVGGAAGAQEDLPSEPVLAPYRVDLLPTIGGSPPTAIGALQWPEGARWPAPLREELEARILTEWPAGRAYGAIHSRVGLWVAYPLINSAPGDRVVVPVLKGAALPLYGRLVIPPPRYPGRLVILIDLSASARSKSLLRLEDGSLERVSAIDAALIAVERILDRLEKDRARLGPGYGPGEVGIIAFGEGTWPVVTPVRSIEEVRTQLEPVARSSRSGTGRTDAVCALHVAADWLEEHQVGPGRIVLLTDGDLPFSGRFTDCDAPQFRGARATAACLRSLNRSPCPTLRGLDSTRGRSDVAQLFSFVREMRTRAQIFPLVFRSTRPPRFLAELARHTGGRSIPVASERRVDVALSHLLSHDQEPIEVRSVRALNRRTGASTGELLDPDGRGFHGALSLVPGPNDVELRIDSDRGRVGLFRFRVYAEPTLLADYLERLHRTNRELQARLDGVVGRTRERLRRATWRELDVAPEPGLASETPAEPFPLYERPANVVSSEDRGGALDFTDHRKTLLAMIDRLLDGEWSIEEFEEQFYWYLRDQVPGGALSGRDLDFFSTISEHLDVAGGDAGAGPSWAEFKRWLDAERGQFGD